MDDPNSTSFSLKFDDNLLTDLSNYTGYDYDNSFEVNSKAFACLMEPMDQVVHIFMCSFYTVIFLLALPGNLIVGLVIGSSKQALSTSDLFLFHLAVADILLALTLPISAASLIHGWVFGNFMCKLVSVVQEVNFYSSILFLVCISVDRYLVIVHAMEARKEDRRLWSWVMCGVVWAAGILLALPVGFNEVGSFRGLDHMTCAESFDPKEAPLWRLSTRLLRHTLGFLLPLVIMLACYGITVARLLRTRGFQKQRAMRVIVAVVLAFLLCWMPYHISMIADTLMRFHLVNYGCKARLAVDRAMFSTQSLGLLHCCINPVLYAFIGEKFRKNLLQLICRKKGLEHGSGSRISRSTSQTSEASSPVM
ncbi:hypothetical protein AGOR_G00062090 [Albula goreensis]|uniref:G-protein coupled receptors family 1 profile domain-containing protein n=1 Tax=Albula goreensis TaxID=1534307 RepID=A0A8T3DU36_9TELE|nr:hypothetical protein AGOR_G00062090 [Albula goreensis]